MTRMIGFGSTLCALLTTLSVAGCSSDGAVDIGDGRRGEALSDYADTWDGYAEAFTFRDGSDRVRVTLDAAGNGFMEVGESAPAPAAPTPGGPPPPYSGSELSPGFAYSILGARVEQKRLRLEIHQYEHFDAWCEQQPAVSLESLEFPDLYSCFSQNVVLETIDNDPENCRAWTGATFRVVPCLAQPTCMFMCECTASGCQGGDRTAGAATVQIGFGPAQLDAVLSDGGETLSGTLVRDSREGVLSPRIAVRLERQ